MDYCEYQANLVYRAVSEQPWLLQRETLWRGGRFFFPTTTKVGMLITAASLPLESLCFYANHFLVVLFKY